ncbi:MAG: DNA repair protein RadA [Ruminococcaceae bacterium]|nr:DNA repair protein RadA [Oscillospiraceae bacterium]
MKTKTVYVCSECDWQSPKWMGRCPQCGSWNTFTEETFAKKVSSPTSASAVRKESAVQFSEMENSDCERTSTRIGELDRVLGGGLVTGSVVLLAGEPGIGKSTLLMQLCGKMGDDLRLLYVSGEESKGQLKIRADRLGVSPSELFVLTETAVETVISEYEKCRPDVVIIDSIQTMNSERSGSTAGSIAQVRECSALIMSRAKADGVSVILVGHVNKEGGIAGPKVLEHMVDAVLCFEGERTQSHRIIRAVKNRYGSTNEIGVFEMTDKGLIEVANPSEMLLSGRPDGVSGSCAVCVLEGTRPIVAEIQALVAPSAYPSPKRTADGLDYNRMCLLLAVLEKRLGIRLSTCDVYLNVVGGLRIDEPAVDAAVAMAIMSSVKDIPVPRDLIVMGEIGLSGEFRAVSSAQQRASEAYRLGFTRIAVPKRGKGSEIKLDGAEIIPMNSIYNELLLLTEGK